MIDGVMGTLAADSDSIFRGSAQLAGHMAQLLAIVELVWFVSHAVIGKRSIEELIHNFAFRVVGLMFALSIIYWISNTGGSYIVAVIMHDFAHAGQSIGALAGGSVGSSPDSFIVQGVSSATALIAADITAPVAGIVALIHGLQVAGIIQTGPSMAPYSGCGAAIAALIGFQGHLASSAVPAIAFAALVVAGMIAAISVLIGFVRLAVELLMVTVETYVVLAASTFLLGFSTSQWTRNISQAYQRYIMMLAFRTFAIYIVAGISVGLINSLSPFSSLNLGNPLSVLTSLFSQILNVFVVAAIVNALLKAPSTIASALMGYPAAGGMGGNAMNSLVHLASTGMAAAGGAQAAFMNAIGGQGHGSVPGSGGTSTGTSGASSAASSAASVSATGGTTSGGGASTAPPTPPGTGSSGGATRSAPSVPSGNGLQRLAGAAQAAFNGAASAGFGYAFGADPFNDRGGASTASSGGNAAGSGGGMTDAQRVFDTRMRQAHAFENAFSGQSSSADDGIPDFLIDDKGAVTRPPITPPPPATK